MILCCGLRIRVFVIFCDLFLFKILLEFTSPISVTSDIPVNKHPSLVCASFSEFWLFFTEQV